MEVQVGPAVVTIHADDRVVVCEPDSKMSATAAQGFFARDTRVVSGYRLKLGRDAPLLLDSCQVEHYSSRFEFTNPSLETTAGTVPAHSLHLRVDRTVGRGVHEDYDLTNYSGMEVGIELEVSFESDFADIFDVKAGRRMRRGSIQSVWDESEAALTTTYRNGEFRRSIRIRAARSGSPTEFANGGLTWRVSLPPGRSWHTCLLWSVDLGRGQADPAEDGHWPCHSLLGRDTEHDRARREWARRTTRHTTSDPAVTAVVRQAVADLGGMRMHAHDEEAGSWADDRQELDAWVPAGGIPWFVSLFGRDSLVVSLQTLSLSPRLALGALRALGRLQADGYDDERDMQPGKIAHEVRHGELAALHLIPHTPYYGTHEATSLYVWTAARSWWWHGDRDEIAAARPHVERALAWVDGDGDLDGDGLQEYRTRARDGYYNQGWKDAGDAIVDEGGGQAKLPIALCEHQGLVVAAKRAWAEVLEHVFEDAGTATRLRAEARRLAEMIEERFWWEEEGTYYLGLDGDKAPLRSVASNPGQLLWSGAVDPDRARLTAERLLADDMWSGWGIRTLSSAHPAYNPFSYQLGSVWPHDNVIAAAGLRRYGLDGAAAKVIRGVLDAAGRFRTLRLPELFAGLPRDPGGFPAQYLGANTPQAWASGSVVQALEVLLGLRADAPGRALVLDPALPDWLTEVELDNLGVGDHSADLVVRRRPDGSHSLEVRRDGGLHVSLAGAGGQP